MSLQGTKEEILARNVERFEWVKELMSDQPGVVTIDRFGGNRKERGYQGEGYLYCDSRLFTKYRSDAPNNQVIGFVEFGGDVEGPPGCVHGGCISAVLDELFGNVVANSIHPETAVTVNLNVNYRKFIPLRSTRKLEAKVEKREGRKIFAVGRILNPEDGTVHAEGTAIYLAVQKFGAPKTEEKNEEKNEKNE
eukprot:TRINITY_DN7515_c0_g4_i1.p1 TRINITY_DN7515_c0_g4~~TRINITY_DN7515_c0_g4_i1.p1  ORF type:complete len:193 (+),score=81.70 TRINITY_DN7515_c0_g4_i1:70-648(+)